MQHWWENEQIKYNHLHLLDSWSIHLVCRWYWRILEYCNTCVWKWINGNNCIVLKTKTCRLKSLKWTSRSPFTTAALKHCTVTFDLSDLVWLAPRSAPWLGSADLQRRNVLHRPVWERPLQWLRRAGVPGWLQVSDSLPVALDTAKLLSGLHVGTFERNSFAVICVPGKTTSFFRIKFCHWSIFFFFFFCNLHSAFCSLFNFHSKHSAHSGPLGLGPVKCWTAFEKGTLLSSTRHFSPLSLSLLRNSYWCFEVVKRVFFSFFLIWQLW